MSQYLDLPFDWLVLVHIGYKNKQFYKKNHKTTVRDADYIWLEIDREKCRPINKNYTPRRNQIGFHC